MVGPPVGDVDGQKGIQIPIEGDKGKPKRVEPLGDGQCMGVTGFGTQCKNPSKPGKSLCTAHEKKVHGLEEREKSAQEYKDAMRRAQKGWAHRVQEETNFREGIRLSFSASELAKKTRRESMRRLSMRLADRGLQ